jgi:hypothetical protein
MQEWSYTMTPGVTASTGTIVLSEQDVQAITNAAVDFIITDGDITIALSDCIVTGLSKAGKGQMRVTFADRRWKWQFGRIDGVYNQEKGLDKDGNPEGPGLERERSPQNLAGLLFEAMGVAFGDYDVSELPDDARPAVDWSNANPAAELGQLVDSLGCTIVLTPESGAKVFKIESGDPLPHIPDAVLDESQSLSVAVYPDVLHIATGPILVESTLVLEAVGIEVEEGPDQWKWLPIDDLSYKPDGAKGWKHTCPWGSFTGCEGVFTDRNSDEEQKISELARSTIYRNYRVKEQLRTPGSFCPSVLRGTPYAITTLDEMLPLRDTLLITDELAPPPLRELPCKVRGTWSNKERIRFAREEQNTKPFTEVPRGDYSIQGKMGIVRFSQPIWRVGEEGDADDPLEFLPAKLELTTSYVPHKEDIDTRLEYTFPADPDKQRGTEMLVVTVPELRPKYIEWFDGKVTSNAFFIRQQCQFYGNEYRAKMTTHPSTSRTYVGIHLISCNGIVSEVTWSGGGGNIGTTRATEYGSHSRYIVDWKTRLRKLRNQRAAAEQRRARAWHKQMAVGRA